MSMLVVGMGDGKATNKREDVLTTYALGSCIAVMTHDASAGVGGLLHLMLPDSKLDASKAAARPWMFADSGLRELLIAVQRLGGDRKRTSVWLAGGAQVLANADVFNIGKRNYQAVRKLLWKEGLIVRGEEVGGTQSRTVRLDVATGQIWIKTGNTNASGNAINGDLQWRLMC
jgi:chemotaxis protein CheD